VISTMAVNGAVVWNAASPPATAPTIKPGDEIKLTGTGFGNGPDVDFSKIMIGNTRVLETDLTMYKQQLDIDSQVNFEIPTAQSSWAKDIVSWTPTEIRFKVPGHASSGPLLVQVQKRTSYNGSLLRAGESHNVIDAQTKRITDDNFQHNCDVVSALGATKGTTPINVTVNNGLRTGLAGRNRRLAAYVH